MKLESDTNLNTKNEIWPNFFIVGAAKAGTTSLYSYLIKVPEVFMPSRKEPHFFAPNVISQSYFHKVSSKEEYRTLFQGVRNQIMIGEASPTYLWDKDSPRLIHEMIPNAKIIIMLRDPVARAYSHYLHHVRDGWENRTFDAAIREDYSSDGGTVWKVPNVYVHQGLYSKQVKRYFDIFDPSNIKIIVFEEFVRDTRRYVSEVMKFLGINSAVPSNVEEVYNPFFVSRNRFTPSIVDSLTRFIHSSTLAYKVTHIVPDKVIFKIAFKLFFKEGKKPPMSHEAKEFLDGIYYEDVQQLENLLDRPLHWTVPRMP